MASNEDIDVLVGERIRRAREKLNLTQAELGERIQKSPKTVWSYEQGNRMMSLRDIPAIADALEVTTFYLLKPIFGEAVELDDEIRDILRRITNPLMRQYWIQFGEEFANYSKQEVKEFPISVSQSDSLEAVIAGSIIQFGPLFDQLKKNQDEFAQLVDRFYGSSVEKRQENNMNKPKRARVKRKGK